jgi:hypothetical protein
VLAADAITPESWGITIKVDWIGELIMDPSNEFL